MEVIHRENMTLRDVINIVKTYFNIQSNIEFYSMLNNIKIKRSAVLCKGQQIHIRLFEIPPKRKSTYYCVLQCKQKLSKFKISFVKHLSQQFDVTQDSILIKGIEKCKQPDTEKLKKNKLKIIFTTNDFLDGAKFHFKKLKLYGKSYLIKPLE